MPTFSPTIQFRFARVPAVAVKPDNGVSSELSRRYRIRAVTYDTLDSYSTRFRFGAFTEGLERRLPRFMYGHAGWSNMEAILGRAIDYDDNAERLELLIELDDFDAVPTARQVAAQMTSGTIDQFSIGFREQGTERIDANSYWITKGEIAEVSATPLGSVPGTGLVGFRSSTMQRGRRVLSVNDAALIVAQFDSGQLDLIGAVRALDDAAHEVRDSAALLDGLLDDEEDEEESVETETDNTDAGADDAGDTDADDNTGDTDADDTELDADEAETLALLAELDGNEPGDWDR